jgi:hypothetical protein
MIIPLPGGTQIDTGNDPTIVYADDGAITLHTPLALSRLIERWKGKPNLAALLASYTDQLQLLENVLWDIVTMRLPDYAAGTQLDTIGRIVGEPRQGQSDAQYRPRLKVRIRINQSFGTADDVIEVLQMLDPSSVFSYTELGSAAFAVEYSLPPTSAVVASQVPRLVSQTRAAGVGATVTIPSYATARAMRWGTTLDVAVNLHVGFGTIYEPGYAQVTGGLFAHIAKA